MTADGLFNIVAALCGYEESDKTDYKNRFIEILNLRMQECKKLNDLYRTKRGMDPLLIVQTVTTLEDELEFEPELLRDVLPLGVAGYLYADDDESGISNDYRSDYLRLINYGDGYARAGSAECEW